MTRWFEAHTLSHHGRYRVVEPTRRGGDRLRRHPSRRPATPRASRCASRASCASATTRPPPRSTGCRTVAALHERLQAGGRYGVLTAAERPVCAMMAPCRTTSLRRALRSLRGPGVTDGRSDEERVRIAARGRCTATGAGIYLATHVAGPLPAETMAAVRESDELELRVGRVGPDRAEDLAQREREARAAVAAPCGAPLRARSCWPTARPRRRAPSPCACLAQRDAVAPSSGCRHRRHAGPSAGRAGAAQRRPGASRSPASARSRPWPPVGARAIAGLDAGDVRRSWSSSHGSTRSARPPGRAAGRRRDRASSRCARCSWTSASASAPSRSMSRSSAPTRSSAMCITGSSGRRALAFAWLAPDPRRWRRPAELRSASGDLRRGALLALARSVGWLLMYVGLPWVVARTGPLARRLYGSLAAIDGVEMLARALAARRRCWPSGSPAGTPSEAADELSRACLAIIDVGRRRRRCCASASAPGTARTSSIASSSVSRSWPPTRPRRCRAGRR